MPALRATQNVVTDWAYRSAVRYGDPFNDIVLDVVIRDTEAKQWCVPAFWGGGGAMVQRQMMWGCMLCGCGGFTYGAQGLFQFNRREEPYGYLPHGVCWGIEPWEDVYLLPGSDQVGIARKLLERFEWWRFEPHPDWVEPHASQDDCFNPYAAGLDGVVRVFYFPTPIFPWTKPVWLTALTPQQSYRGHFFDVVGGKDYPTFEIKADSEGRWKVPVPPYGHDWVLVVEGSY